jgi:hypothetical protein
MSFTIFSQPERRHRRRGNRAVGKIWLVVLFIALTAMNYAGTFVLPYLGTYAKAYQGALFIATIWNTVLLGAIWYRQGWARVALAIFLLAFVAVQLVYVPDVLVRYPDFRDGGMLIVLLLSATDFLAALFLIFSLDIRWVSRPGTD